MRTRIACLAVLLFAFVAARNTAAQVTDAGLGDEVSRCLQHYSHFTIFDDVTIVVSNRNVTLTGWVTEPYKRDDVGKQVARIDGIRTFTNAVTVLPVSLSDGDLRQRLAKAIYGNAMFWRYASMTNPPIHIIVDRGSVRLTGCVGDENERQFAFALAHVNGALLVRNDLRIDK